MAYTPIIATLGYVLSPDQCRVLMIHRNARSGDAHLGKYNGLGGKVEPVRMFWLACAVSYMRKQGLTAFQSVCEARSVGRALANRG